MHTITHRGLDFEHNHTFTESSRESFQYFLNAGFGLEFDVRITLDGIPVISHDASLSRLTEKTEPDITAISAEEFLNTALPNGHTLTLEELITLMRQADIGDGTHALHLKHPNQSPEDLSILIPYLNTLTNLPLIVFDVLPEIAEHLKREIPKISLASSVAHPFDIERYNNAVGGTLVSVDAMKNYTNLYDWVWLDEWDRTDQDSEKKALYTEETFSFLRGLGYKLAVVSPELHATSPKLLGGESHPDATTFDTLTERWRELLLLAPDAICTDYPKFVSSI